jgi:hypothetical protein
MFPNFDWIVADPRNAYVLHRAVPYAAIGMAIWFAMQWYIVRTQDKLWLAREYHIARRKGKA